MLYKPFPLLFSDFRFQFASLCTTNFWGFWFFWMAFSCTSIVRKYCWLPLSVHCTSSYALSLQERSWLPSWRPSVLTSVWQFLSSSSSHPPAWVCIWLCWLSSMRAVRGRGGHPSGHPSCGVSAAGWGRSSAACWYYVKLLIIPIMWSISLWEVSQLANKLIR